MNDRTMCATCGYSVLVENWTNHVLGKKHERKSAPTGWLSHFGVRHGVIEYDGQDEWLTETDLEGASRIVARDVDDWFGHLVVAALSATQGSSNPEHFRLTGRPANEQPCCNCGNDWPCTQGSSNPDTRLDRIKDVLRDAFDTRITPFDRCVAIERIAYGPLSEGSSNPEDET